MAGVTSSGFVTKRFTEVLEGLREQAVPVFQDLVTPGDFVDTSDSTVIGRLIGLTSPAISEVWEAMQQVYAAFDPNTSSGIALDNLVSIGGLTRRAASSTKFSSLVWGDTNTSIPPGSGVKGSTSPAQFINPIGVTLSASSMSGAGFQITDTTVGNNYSISLASTSGITNISTTALAGETADVILGRLNTQLSGSTVYTSWVVDETLYVKLQQHYSSFNTSVVGDIAVMKVAKRLEFSAETDGPIDVPMNTVNNITTPVLGWDTVENPVPASVGSDVETDTQLRERFRVSKFLRASNTQDSLYSALLELAGVQEVRLYINDTDLTNSIGLAPHSFLALVLGGIDIDIARTIWKHTPLGIKGYGGQTVTLETTQGTEYIVRFDRPVYVPLFVEIDLTTDASFPDGGQELIREALVDYFQSSQTIGGKVVYSRLFNPVNSIPGHEIVTLKIGTSSGSLTETTLNMAYNEIAILPPSNITFI